MRANCALPETDEKTHGIQNRKASRSYTVPVEQALRTFCDTYTGAREASFRDFLRDVGISEDQGAQSVGSSEETPGIL